LNGLPRGATKNQAFRPGRRAPADPIGSQEPSL
jgi:hypothetical protein